MNAYSSWLSDTGWHCSPTLYSRSRQFLLVRVALPLEYLSLAMPPVKIPALRPPESGNPPLVEECTMEDRLSDGCDAGQDEVDAGQELLAVVVPGQLRRHLMREWVFRGVELRPPCGDGC